MSAANADRNVSTRQPGDMVAYNGASGFLYYIGAMVMKNVSGAVIQPMLGNTTGVSNCYFLGVNRNRVDLTAGLGSSQQTLDVYKTGIFTFLANGTGVSSDIGLRAYALDDQTVGNSINNPSLYVGEIVALGSSTNSYRVRIDPAINQINPFGVVGGLSGFTSLARQN